MSKAKRSFDYKTFAQREISSFLRKCLVAQVSILRKSLFGQVIFRHIGVNN